MRVAITSGEPAGIGPDLCIKLLASHELSSQNESSKIEYVLLGNRSLFRQRAEQLGVTINLPDYQPDSRQTFSLLNLDTSAPVTAGKLNSTNAAYVCNMLTRAAEGCLSGEFDAVVTAPVQKSVINDAGIPFSGHTEFFAELCQAHPVMMLAADNPAHPELKALRVALVTTHLPLIKVPTAITPSTVTKVVKITNQALRERFGISGPNIAVCGLNPHAGESGHLGDEEIEVIQPVINDLRKQGLKLSDPLPADTLFAPKIAKQYDAIISMYHDQGLPVLKHYGFGNAVNITLGLPIIRTSVDHGTALDLAGTGNIDTGSLKAAIDSAVTMATNQSPA